MREILIVTIMNRTLSLVRIKMIKIMNLVQLNKPKMGNKFMKKRQIDHLLKRSKRKFSSNNYNNRNLEQLKKKSKLDNQIRHPIPK